MKTLNDLDPAVYAAYLAKTIAAQQAKMDNLPDWWQQVLMELHDRMQCEFLWNQEYEDAPKPSLLERRTIARFCSHYAEIYEVQPPKITRRDNECPVCSEPTQTASGELTGNPHSPDCDYLPPWKGGSAPAELPDYLQLPGMEHTRINLLDWRKNGFDARLGELESHSLPYRLETLEAFLDFDPQAPASDAFPDDIHQLIAEGMTGVTTDMHAHLERMTRRIDDLQDLLLKAVLKVDALETKTPC